jgi:hypothetical protein
MTPVHSIDRRTFLKTVAAGATLAGASTWFSTDVAQTAEALLPMRELGKTGFRSSVLGIGVAPLGIKQTDAKTFEAVVNAALDAGINFVDVAPNYGNAEERLGPVMAKRRDGVFLVTKVEEASRDGAIRQVENSLRLLRTDHVDAVHLHNIGDFDADAVVSKSGALEGLKECRKRGLVRFIGVSGHMRPKRFVPLIESGSVDLFMAAMNFVDRHTYNFEETVLPVARTHGVAAVAMKVLGGAVGMRYHIPTPALLAEEITAGEVPSGEHYRMAIRYALGLEGVSTLVIGMKSLEELNAAVETIRTAKPLSAAERDLLVREGKRLASQWGAHFGPVA